MITCGSLAWTMVKFFIFLPMPIEAKANGSMAEYDHIPGLHEQLAREPRALPRLEISPEIQHLDDVTALLEADTESLLQTFRLHDYDPHPALTFKVAV